MYTFSGMVPDALVCLVWLAVFCALFGLNEVTRRCKWVGFAAFVVLPTVLTIMWFTVLSDTAYMDWFHLAKVYSSTAGCIGFGVSVLCMERIRRQEKSGIYMIIRLPFVFHH